MNLVEQAKVSLFSTNSRKKQEECAEKDPEIVKKVGSFENIS